MSDRPPQDLPEASAGGEPPVVVIIGAGFAGLTAARALARARVRVVVIDRRNHHLFQPLLYQVATAMLSPADIAAPARSVLSRYDGARVLLAEAQRVDPADRTVHTSAGPVRYDRLIIAAGARTSYFGHDDWPRCAPGLKTIDDALEIRRRFLLAFEEAELARTEDERRKRLTFVVIGGGPTGVELAGAMIEVARRAMPRDFRSIDPATARVLLVEAGPRLLPAFPEALGRRARDDLQRLGVEIHLNAPVVEMSRDSVTLGHDPDRRRIDGANIIWAAGVRAEPIAESLGVTLDRSGRVPVEPDLTIPGRPEIFVVGDLAKVTDPRTGRDVPGMAPGALQMGAHAARTITRELAARRAGRPAPAREPFRYRDKGMLAVIGRARAVAALPNSNFTGLPAWVLWAAVHLYYLVGYRNRIIVMLEWLWNYITWQRGARLITGPSEPARNPRVDHPNHRSAGT